MRLIDADKLNQCVKEPSMYDINQADFLSLISEQPTVDAVEVIHGKWNDTYKSGYIPVPKNVCSVCDCCGERRSDYCPNCGAKMN